MPDRDEPLEAWTTLAFLASITERVRLGSEVTPVTLRHPPLLAKTVATLDVLSGGRVTLGAGTGWHRREYVTQGLPFERRAERFEKSREALEVMRRLWREDAVDHEGRFYRLQGALVAPKPVQEGGPRSGSAASPTRSSASSSATATAGSTARTRRRSSSRSGARLHELAREAGRDPAAIRVVVPLMAHVSSDGERARASLEGYVARGDFGRWLADFFGENASRYGLVGTPEDAWERLRPYLEIGVRDFIFDLRPPGIAEETATLLAEHVLPRLAQV